MCKAKLAILLLLLLFACSCSDASASSQVYYVDNNDPDASDSASGSLDSPWKTIQKAVQTANAGDKVYIRGGDYTVSASRVRSQPALNPAHSGTKDNPIVFESYEGENVSISAVSGGGPILGASGRNFIIWKNLTVTESADFLTDSGVVVLWNADNCTIEGLEIIGRNRNQVDNHNGIRLERASNSVIKNNIIHGFTNTSNPESHNNSGITMYHGTNSIVENNTIYDCNALIYDKVQGVNNIYRFNYFHSAPRGIIVQSGTDMPSCQGDRIYQNIFLNLNSVGIDLRRRVNDLHIYNNTFYNVNGSADFGTISIISSSNITNIEVFNNVITESNNPYHLRNNVSGLSYSDYNSFYNSRPFRVSWSAVGGGSLSGWKDNYSFDVHSLEDDPGFVEASSNLVDGYKLSQNSSLKEAGRNGTTIGAYITGEEFIGLLPRDTDNSSDSSDDAVLKSPQNLKVVGN